MDLNGNSTLWAHIGWWSRQTHWQIYPQPIDLPNGSELEVLLIEVILADEEADLTQIYPL